MKKYIKSIIIISLLISFFGCSKPLTTALFMQSKRVEIYLPTAKEEKGQSSIIAENVTYKQKIDTIKPENKDLENAKQDGIKSLDLKEVVITSNRPKIKVSNIRNGKISLNFLMSIPEVFMNDRYRVAVYPKLINGDSLVDLKPVVFIGKEFQNKQDKELAAFKLEDSITVSKMKYDSVFFYNKKHSYFMTHLQKRYLRDYYKRYDKMKDYIRWNSIMQERFMHFNALYEGRYNQRKADKALDVLDDIYNAMIAKKDTTKLSLKYNEISSKEYTDSVKNIYARKITRDIVPERFQDIYCEYPSMDSVRNFSTTELDSVRIAKQLYDYVSIAKNEQFHNNREKIIANMHFRAIEPVQEIIDIEPKKATVIMYTEDIPVTENLSKNLKVIVETKVMATDLSTWKQKGIDTLSFVVTGLNDLADTTMLEAYKYNQQYYDDYKAGLDRLKVRDYTGALTILRFYPDYNASVCLVALGMNDKALELLNKIPETGKSLYLKSIVLVRLNRIDEAKKALEDACRKESFLGYKADIEPELSKLFDGEDFGRKIQNIADGIDF